jgi:hypothetical protein
MPSSSGALVKDAHLGGMRRGACRPEHDVDVEIESIEQR